MCSMSGDVRQGQVGIPGWITRFWTQNFDSKFILAKLKFIIYITGSKEELEEDCDNDLCSPV